MGPLAGLQLSEGYAVAASSYSLTGWAVFETVADNEEMVRAFEDEFGVPDQVMVHGASLGGIVTAQAIEQANLGNVVGALPFCGAVGGSRIWDGGVDLRLIYDAICGDVAGTAIPGGANGLPSPPDPGFDQTAMALAVNACMGLLQSPDMRTPEQVARLNDLLNATGLPESFILTDMGFSTFGLADLVYDPRKMNGGQAFVNTDIDYGDAQLNADVERIQADRATSKRPAMGSWLAAWPKVRVGSIPASWCPISRRGCGLGPLVLLVLRPCVSTAADSVRRSTGPMPWAAWVQAGPSDRVATALVRSTSSIPTSTS